METTEKMHRAKKKKGCDLSMGAELENKCKAENLLYMALSADQTEKGFCSDKRPTAKPDP
ncbi:hypothetical protein [Flavobacterium tistrianum]|uniref:hypothetical protein n=1 Tax=Flavobacterium tistrianum TaxID=1685414 RepID=UPI000DAC5350|nr:hypothetical protein [Flavobacterium tistrianum]KAF2342893.1 hypothetical protein DMB71_01460 [Flavobacterium tistrianum]